MSDHEMIPFRGHLIPVLGTVGGTAEQSRETAKNIEQFIAAKRPARRCILTPRGAIIHAADVGLSPLCSQTNNTKDESWQQVIGPVTCKRCLRVLAIIDQCNAPQPLEAP